MSNPELFAQLRQLSAIEKFQIVQFLMAELTKERARLLNLVVGLGIFLFGVVFLVVVELVAVIARGGVL